MPPSRTPSSSSPRSPRAKARASVAALVRALNDPGRGELLDALLEVRRRSAGTSRSSGWEAETLAALAQGLLERLAQAGIRPLRVPGEKLVLTARQLGAGFQYHGRPFRPGERRKQVLVATPGWAVGRRTVVRPAVREAPEEERG